MVKSLLTVAQPEDVRAGAHILAARCSCSLSFKVAVARASAKSPVSGRKETKVVQIGKSPNEGAR